MTKSDIYSISTIFKFHLLKQNHSPSLRNYIFVDEFKEKITEILKQKFTDWDGEELTIDGLRE